MVGVSLHVTGVSFGRVSGFFSFPLGSVGDPIGIGRAEIFGGTGGAGNPICWHRAGVLRIHRIFLGPIYLSHDSKTAYISDHKVA